MRSIRRNLATPGEPRRQQVDSGRRTEEHWRRFCGARIDPQFWQLTHPARWTGAVRVAAGAPVVIVGSGPSLRSSLPALRRVRRGLCLFTSPRGADALLEAGLVPDLVVVEHQTALDAHFSVQDVSHRHARGLACAPLIAADARTPAALLAGIAPDRLFVPDPLPTWGLWPATAAALALASGAGSVSLLGVDLGLRGRPDPSQTPLRHLLELLAAHTEVPCGDAGAGGSEKAGWRLMTLDALAAGGPVHGLTPRLSPWLSTDARYRRAGADWQQLGPLAAEAEAALASAARVRDGDRSADACAAMRGRFARLLEAGADPDIRALVQDGLGCSFLPRYWRTPPDRTLGERLWRPLALAAHEVTGQYHTLGERLLGRPSAR